MRKWLTAAMCLISLNSFAETQSLKEPLDYQQIFYGVPKEATELVFKELAKPYKGKKFEDFGRVVDVKPNKYNDELAIVLIDTDADDNHKMFPDLSVSYPKAFATRLVKGETKIIKGTIFEIVNLGGAHVIINDADVE